MKNAIRLISAGALLAVGIPISALAQTITINASVVSQCNIGNATVNVGPLTLSSQTNSTGTNIVLTCNKGATVGVALDNGANASGTQKRLKHTTLADVINYNISVPTISGTTTSCPTLPGTEWNATNTLVAGPMFGSSGGTRDLALCVSVPSGQFGAGAGAYQDTVTATLSVS